jgi:hypothetical protein
MTRYITPIIIAGSLFLAAGCGDDSDKQPQSSKPAAAAKSDASAAPYGTYVRTMTKADLARTAKLRDEAGPHQSTPPTGQWSLVIAKGAAQDVLKATDPTNFTIAMDLNAKDDALDLTSYVNPNQGSFCGPEIPSNASYKFTSDGGKLVLEPSGQDPCADRDAILTGTWTKG